MISAAVRFDGFVKPSSGSVIGETQVGSTITRSAAAILLAGALAFAAAAPTSAAGGHGGGGGGGRAFVGGGGSMRGRRGSSPAHWRLWRRLPERSCRRLPPRPQFLGKRRRGWLPSRQSGVPSRPGAYRPRRRIRLSARPSSRLRIWRKLRLRRRRVLRRQSLLHAVLAKHQS